MEKVKTILSLGAGVQSTFIILALKNGFFGIHTNDLPEAAIFSDSNIPSQKLQALAGD